MLKIRVCSAFCLNSSLVEGKIVVCDDASGSKEAYRASALGAIVLNEDRKDVAFVLSLPASTLAKEDYDVVMSYINSTE